MRSWSQVAQLLLRDVHVLDAERAAVGRASRAIRSRERALREPPTIGHSTVRSRSASPKPNSDEIEQRDDRLWLLPSGSSSAMKWPSSR